MKQLVVNFNTKCEQIGYILVNFNQKNYEFVNLFNTFLYFIFKNEIYSKHYKYCST